MIREYQTSLFVVGIQHGQTVIRPTLPPAVHGSETSVAAGRSVAGVTGEMRRRVYDYVRSRGQVGATRQEIEVALDMAGNTVRPRVAELMAAGAVRETGEHRKTIAGRAAVVLVAVLA